MSKGDDAFNVALSPASNFSVNETEMFVGLILDKTAVLGAEISPKFTDAPEFGRKTHIQFAAFEHQTKFEAKRSDA